MSKGRTGVRQFTSDTSSYRSFWNISMEIRTLPVFSTSWPKLRRTRPHRPRGNRSCSRASLVSNPPRPPAAGRPRDYRPSREPGRFALSVKLFG